MFCCKRWRTGFLVNKSLFHLVLFILIIANVSRFWGWGFQLTEKRGAGRRYAAPWVSDCPGIVSAERPLLPGECSVQYKIISSKLIWNSSARLNDGVTKAAPGCSKVVLVAYKHNNPGGGKTYKKENIIRRETHVYLSSFLFRAKSIWRLLESKGSFVLVCYWYIIFKFTTLCFCSCHSFNPEKDKIPEWSNYVQTLLLR